MGAAARKDEIMSAAERLADAEAAYLAAQEELEDARQRVLAAGIPYRDAQQELSELLGWTGDD